MIIQDLGDESKMLEMMKVRKKCVDFVSSSYEGNTGVEVEVDIKSFDA